MRQGAILTILCLILLSGCLTGSKDNYSSLDLGRLRGRGVELNDTVRISYILSTADKQVLDTSIEEVAVNWDLNLSHPFEPRTLKVGEDSMIPGLKDVLIGMKVGEQKETLIPSDEAYGEREENLVKTMGRKLEIPRIDRISTEEFGYIFQGEPLIGGNYSLRYWNSTVLGISGDNVTVLNDAKEGNRTTPWGSVTIVLNNSKITLISNPRVGAPIHTLEGEGRVISMGPENYTVDLNHPLAGEAILIFVRVEEIIKPGSEDGGEITLGGQSFLTSLEEGKNLSKESGKTIFLYFHASWCSWCRRFENDVLTNPDVLETLSHDFIAVAVDVDRNTGTAGRFKIIGTPSMIFLDAEGQEIYRVRGYQSLDDFKETLVSVGKIRG